MSLTDSIVPGVTEQHNLQIMPCRSRRKTNDRRSPTVTLNRPERRNALTIELMTELTAAIEDAAADPKQRILILRGAGKAFCTGLDLEAAADSSKAHATAEMVARMLLALAKRV